MSTTPPFDRGLAERLRVAFVEATAVATRVRFAVLDAQRGISPPETWTHLQQSLSVAQSGEAAALRRYIAYLDGAMIKAGKPII